MSDAPTSALVVTGTSDSGSAIVRKVAEAGGTVGFTYNQSSVDADALLDEIKGDDHVSWQCDVTDVDDVSRVVDAAFDTLGSIDAIIFTVGVISRAPIPETSGESWRDHLGANLTGAFALVKAAAPHLESQGEGSIVALSASEGILRNPMLSAYDASKQGLEAFIKETARELGPAGVRANVVAPGFIRDPESLSAEQQQDLLDQQYYKRITTPEDIANTCLFLCSDEAATITGAVVPVDSGLAL